MHLEEEGLDFSDRSAYTLSGRRADIKQLTCTLNDRHICAFRAQESRSLTNNSIIFIRRLVVLQDYGLHFCERMQ
jgi:hypothetical protein